MRIHFYRICSCLLLLLNLCVVVPIALMVKLEKPVHMTLIPAIAMAAYAFYKITLASINMVKQKRSRNRLVRLLRSINFIDALMSIVTLQNTLIMAVSDGNTDRLLPLTAAAGGVIWLVIVVVSVQCFLVDPHMLHPPFMIRVPFRGACFDSVLTAVSSSHV